MTRRWYRSFDPGLVGHTFSDRSLSMRFSSPGRVRQRTAGGRGGWERVRKGGGGVTTHVLSALSSAPFSGSTIQTCAPDASLTKSRTRSPFLFGSLHAYPSCA
jgi:hypothetical protein